MQFFFKQMYFTTSTSMHIKSLHMQPISANTG